MHLINQRNEEGKFGDYNFKDEYNKLKTMVERLKVLTKKEFELKKLLDQNIFNKVVVTLSKPNYNATWTTPADCTEWLRRNNKGEFDALKSLFDKYDKGHNGTLSPDEVYSCFKELGYVINREKFDAFFASMDADGNGYLDFDEWVVFFQRAKGQSKTDITGATDYEPRGFKLLDKSVQSQ